MSAAFAPSRKEARCVIITVPKSPPSKRKLSRCSGDERTWRMPTECSSVRMGGWDREGVGATEGITEVIQIGYQSKAVQYCACMRLAAWWGDSIRRDSLGAGGWGGPSKCAVRPSGSRIIRCDAPAPRTITRCSVTSCWAGWSKGAFTPDEPDDLHRAHGGCHCARRPPTTCSRTLTGQKP